MPPDADLADALARPDLPPAFERFRVELGPGERRPVHRADWAGCLVLVERGTIEVGCEAGPGRSFSAGDLLALGWLPLRTLRNIGPGPARLLAVRRSADRPREPVRTSPTTGLPSTRR